MEQVVKRSERRRSLVAVMTKSAEPQTPPPSRRERKRQEIRDRLYTCALDLFLEQGVDATTMDDIAERADTARTTVFNHFPQKGLFLQEWGRRRRDRVTEIMAAEHTEDLPAADQLRRYLSALAELNTNSRTATITLMDAAIRVGGAISFSIHDVELTKIIEKGQLGGEFRSDSDASQAGTVLAAGYFAGVLRWIGSEPEPFALSTYLDDLLDLILRGLADRH
ncbi:TetR/AcrR family transcriptional regulator [Streptomyces sp. GbtcB6]|uniref:TetR/AcrR family transcriptional regulator n=1 Tax=Streptomyces sp. GbtcB6 TaxID=2824751 RepID=UPI0027E59A3B|nr:TetR/AcrR family transcriptional regulator [Streptomyces sp. GbtcB6]